MIDLEQSSWVVVCLFIQFGFIRWLPLILAHALCLILRFTFRVLTSFRLRRAPSWMFFSRKAKRRWTDPRKDDWGGRGGGRGRIYISGWPDCISWWFAMWMEFGIYYQPKDPIKKTHRNLWGRGIKKHNKQKRNGSELKAHRKEDLSMFSFSLSQACRS